MDKQDVVDFKIGEKGEGHPKGSRGCNGNIRGSGRRRVTTAEREALIERIKEECHEVRREGEGLLSKYRVFQIPSGGYVAISPVYGDATLIMDDYRKLEGATRIGLTNSYAVVKRFLYKGGGDELFDKIMKGAEFNYEDMKRFRAWYETRGGAESSFERKEREECFYRYEKFNEKDFLSPADVCYVFGKTKSKNSWFYKFLKKNEKLIDKGCVIIEEGNIKVRPRLVEKMILDGRFVRERWSLEGVVDGIVSKS